MCDDHGFKDEKLFYRFRRDDGTYAGPLDAPLVAKAQRIYSRYGLLSRTTLLASYHICMHLDVIINSRVDFLLEYCYFLMSLGFCPHAALFG